MSSKEGTYQALKNCQQPFLQVHDRQSPITDEPYLSAMDIAIFSGVMGSS